MKLYVQTDETGRILLATPRFMELDEGEIIDQDVTGMIEVDFPGDFDTDYLHEYILVNGEIVYDPSPETIDSNIAEVERKKREKLISDLQEANVIETISDINDGLIEVADLTADNEVSNAEIRDALIELADMVASLMEV